MAEANDTFIEVEEFEDHFARVPKYAISDIKLTLKAKGLYAYLSALPKNWKLYRSQMLKHVADGKDSLNTAFKELEAHGYLVSTPIRDKGQFKGYKLKVMIKPVVVENEPLRKNRSGETGAGETVSGKSAPIKNNSKKNNSKSLSNDKDTHSDDLFAAAGVDVPAKEKTKRKNSGQKEKVLMRDAPEFDIEYLKSKFTGTVYVTASIEYYYEAALAWSDKDAKTAIDWTATVRGFILRDKRDGKLVTAENKEEKLGGIQDTINNWDDI